MENQPYNGYVTGLHEGHSRRSQPIAQHGNSIGLGSGLGSIGVVMSNSMGQHIDSPSRYVKGVAYNTPTTQNCDSYLYGNSSRDENSSIDRKTAFIQSRDVTSNSFKSYTNDTDDELAYASASLAYRREELEARLRGHSTIDSAGSNSTRNRHSDMLNMAANNLSPASDVLMSRERSPLRSSLDVPSFNGTNPLKRQYSTDTRWGGNRFTQQRSWDLHTSQPSVTQDPNRLAPPTLNGSRGLSRSFDDSAIMQSSNMKSSHSSRKRALERGVTYHGNEGTEYHQDCHTGKEPQYGEYTLSKSSLTEHPPPFGRETIVRDFKPGYQNILNGSGSNELPSYPYISESSVRNRRLGQKLTNNNEYDNTTDHRVENLRQSQKHYDENAPYSESKQMSNGVNDEMFMEPDYRHLLNPQNENHTPEAYRKASKNGSIQWWKNQLNNTSSGYKDSIGYNYTHHENSLANSRNINNGYKESNLYPIRDTNLPDVTVNVTSSQQHYNDLSSNKSFWSKFNVMGSKDGGSQYNTTLHAPTIDGGHLMDNENVSKSHYDPNISSNFDGRREDGHHYNSNINNSFNNQNINNIEERQGLYMNKNGIPINDQINYQSMDERMPNNSYVGFSTILDNQKQKGVNVSIVSGKECS